MTPKRMSQRMKAVAKQVAHGDGEHRLTEWTSALCGACGVAFFGRLAWDQRAGGIDAIRVFLVFMLLSALLIPGIAGKLATNAGRLGHSLAKAWKARQ